MVSDPTPPPVALTVIADPSSDDDGLALLRTTLSEPMRIKLSAGAHRLRFVDDDGSVRYYWLLWC